MTTSEAMRATLSWLATYGLHSTLFLGGAWLVCRLRAPRANRNRERLWKLALVGGVLSASLQLAAGLRPLFGRIDWAPLAIHEASDEASNEASDVAEAVAARASEPRERAPVTHPLREPRAHSPERVVATSERPDADRARPLLDVTTPRAALPIARELGDSGVQAVEASSGCPTPPTASTSMPAAEAAPGLVARLGTRLARTAELLTPRWPVLVLLGWTVAGFAGLLGLVASWTCLRRRMLGREVLRDGPLHAQLDELRARAGLRRRVRLSVSERIRAPFSTGLLWPEVCVPRAVLTELSRAQQQALLAHELAHLVRRDPAWFGLGFLLETLFFFQPLNRLARSELGELAELACDDWAVRWTGARLALASCLTEVAGWVVGEPRRRLAQPGLAGQRSRLGQRVTRLLDDRRSPAGEPQTPWWPPLAGASLALVALAVPGVSAVREARPAPALVPDPLPDPVRWSQPTAPLPTAPLAASPTLEAERGVLESELVLLESELAALRAELAQRALDARFAETLAGIDARMAALRAQHLAVRALVARLAPANTPAPAPAPADAAPLSTAGTGDPR